MIIDYLSRAILISVSLVSLVGPDQFMYAVSFSDVSEQVGARPNPQTGLVELRKFPICSRSSVRFLETQAIYFIRSDGNYCSIFTENESYHLHFTLKNMLARYAGLNFLRVHKSYVVNTDRVERIERDASGKAFISFGRETMPMVPLARRKMQELRDKLGLSGTLHGS